MNQHHLILGGARSGKSGLAENIALQSALARHHTPVLIATAQAGDLEMSQRIDQHQRDRDGRWQLIEEPIDIAAALSGLDDERVVVIDCMTLWLSNCLHQANWPQHKQAFLETLSSTPHQVIIVSNEVGQGIVPLGQLSRQFVDESGWLHQALAKLCAHVTLVTAGLPQTLK